MSPSGSESLSLDTLVLDTLLGVRLRRLKCFGASWNPGAEIFLLNWTPVFRAVAGDRTGSLALRRMDGVRDTEGVP